MARPLAAAIEADDVRWVALGVVMGAHGLHGALRVKVYNPESQLLFELPEIALRSSERLTAYRLREVRPGGKGLLVQLDGVDTVEAAGALRGAELCVPREALPELPPGEFYFVDLEGLAVARRDGTALGVAERVLEYPAAQVLEVRTAEGSLEVPLFPPYLVDVDLGAGKIVVDQLEDLSLVESEPRR